MTVDHSSVSARGVSFLVKVLFTIMVLVIFISMVDWAEAGKTLLLANALGLAASFFVLVSVITLDGVRLHAMMRSEGIAFPRHIEFAYQSMFISQLAFGAISGDAYRIARYAKMFGRPLSVSMSVLAARLSGFASVIVIGVLAAICTIYFNHEAADLGAQTVGFVIINVGLVSAGVVFTIGILLWVFLKLKRVDHTKITREIITAFMSLSFYVWVISLSIVILRIVALLCILLALGQHTHLYVIALASVTASLAGLLPFILGGLGVKEGAIVGVLTLLGTTIPFAVAAALLLRLMTVFATCICVLISLKLSTMPTKTFSVPKS